MYSQIAANKRKTIGIMLLFIVIFAAVGYAYSLYTGNYASVAVIAGFALIYSLVSYFVSARVALAINGAKLITKKDNPRLYRTVENLAITAGLPMPKVYIMQDAALNAFATGHSPKDASVAVTSGLLEKLSDTELEAVMAHELGHVQNYDIRLMIVVFACVSIIGLVSDFLLRLVWWGGDEEGASPVAMAVALILALLAPLVAVLIQLAVSRRREYLADASGTLLTRYPEGLVSALEKIAASGSVMKRQNSSTAHLFFANPLKGKQLARLFSTHPPIEDRIARLQQMGSSL